MSKELPIHHCTNCGRAIYEDEAMFAVDTMNYIYCGTDTKCLLNRKQSKEHLIYGFSMERDYINGYYYWTTAQKSDILEEVK
jgi:predicted nucleic acid-binding Zn ribbon protein